MVSKQLYFEDVNEGTELPPKSKPIESKHLVMYEAVTWDFYPGHYDRDYAKGQGGFKDIYVDGPMVIAWYGHMLTDWIGNDGRIQKVIGRYKNSMYPGDTITTHGKVVKKYTEGNRNLVELDLQAENQNGATTSTGKATVTLPSR